MQTECTFSEPKLFNGELPENENQIFNYSKMVCTTTDETVALIANEISGNDFYLKKTISYADLLILCFLLIFLCLGITKFFLDWFIPKSLDWKKH